MLKDQSFLPVTFPLEDNTLQTVDGDLEEILSLKEIQE